MRADAYGAAGVEDVGRAIESGEGSAQEQLLAEIADDIDKVCPEYRELAQNLRRFAARHLAAQEPRGLLLGVVSARAGEGRTTVALGLAGALADMSSSTVFVELGTDPEQTPLADELDLPATPGLHGILHNDVALENAIQATSRQNLWLLPAGIGAGNNPRPLAASVPASLLSTLRQRYAVTIVDVPPLLQSEEGPALVSHVDGAVLVISAGRTTAEQANDTLALLGTVPLRGVLLNQVQTRAPRWIASLLHDR